jgi:hypothetical protein
MLTNDKLAYIHMPKTGGTYVRTALLKAGWEEKDGHVPARRVNKDLAFFGSIRDPMTWYESLYLCSVKHTPEFKGITFKEALSSWQLPRNHGMTPWPPIGPFSRMEHRPYEPLWTASVFFWFGDGNGGWKVPCVICMDSLREGLGNITGVKDLIDEQINCRDPDQSVTWDYTMRQSVRDSVDWRIWTELCAVPISEPVLQFPEA